MLDLAGDDQLIDRLCREAHDGVRASLRGKPAEQVRAAVHSALRGTVFRYELVLRIYVTAHELLDREALIDAALSANIALLTTEGRAERRRDQTYTERFATYRGLLAFQVSELGAAQEARAIVQNRFLDGHAALFPDVAAAWDEQLRDTAAIAEMAVRMAEFHGVAPAVPCRSRSAVLPDDRARGRPGRAGHGHGTGEAW
jgi:hypothetical protein